MAEYSIKDLEKLTGIKAHTLRIWEKRYNIVEPKRTATNYRYYDDEDLKLLLNIALLNHNGYKISHIAKMDEEQMFRAVDRLSSGDSSYENHIDALVISMMELNEQKFDKQINNCILSYGFEETMMKVIYPLFEKVGILWQTGSINPAKEHFISNLVRQKLIVAIDGQIPPEITAPKKFLLFLPEEELHEFSLLFYLYLIRKHGHKVIYLGQAVPFDDVVEIFQDKQPDYIITSITTYSPKDGIDKYIRNLSVKCAPAEILISGLQVRQNKLSERENVTELTDARHMKQMLQDIKSN